MRNNDEKRYRKQPGRPRWSGERVTKCDVRLNDEEDAMLNHLAERNDVSRSDIMRKALKDFYRFNSEEE